MNGWPCSSTRVKSSRPAVTTGFWAKDSSAAAEEASSLLSEVAARRLTAPRAKACPSGGATVRSEAVAEAVEVLLVCDPRRLVEHVEERFDVDRFARVRHRDRCAGLQRLTRGAFFEFQVLEPDRGDRQHDRAGVRGQRFDAFF